MSVYEELSERLTRKGSGRPMERRKVANNTYLIRGENAIGLLLHSTIVASYGADDTVTLNSGGWRTVTTKDRMNLFSGLARFVVNSNGGIWFVKFYPPDNSYFDRWTFDNSAIRYFDGMKLDLANRRLLNPEDSPDFGNIDHANDATNKAIDRYLKGFTPDVARDLLAQIETGGYRGDCWFCSMRSTEDGRPLGETVNDTEHLVSHLEERYYMVSLVVNAYSRYGDPGLVAMLNLRDLAEGRARQHGLKYELRRYFRRQLIRERAVA